MSLISLASGKSLWRGYEYYTGKRIYMKMKKGENEYTGKVIGNGQTYDVHIDLEHPRKSKCNCPLADGKRIICKHMVALYFDAFPDEAEAYIREVEEYERKQEELQNELDDKIRKYLNRASKEQLKETLYNLLYECPEWLFDRFVYEYID